MAAKRQTVDIAAIKQQAEARGREAGRQDLAVELMDDIDQQALRTLWLLLEGLTFKMPHGTPWKLGCEALQKVLGVGAKVAAEATNPGF